MFAKLCELYCRYDHLDLCDTRSLPNSGDFNVRQMQQFTPNPPSKRNLNARFPIGRFWRFQVYMYIGWNSVVFSLYKEQNQKTVKYCEVIADPTVELWQSRDVDSYLRQITKNLYSLRIWGTVSKSQTRDYKSCTIQAKRIMYFLEE
jgi:hypothetical protein